jgi:tetratricopeptide (TPR) repeat protein
MRDEVEKAFQTYMDILKNYPADVESLYHIAFISLGQEEFDIAQRYFDRLLKLKNDNYEILFGAGICYYQNMRIQDAIDNFKSALQIKPQSEIAQISAAFACNRKRDYRQALGYISKIADTAQDPDVQYLAKRFQAFMLMRLKRHEEGIKLFQDLLEIARKNANDDAELLALYDLGYAYLKNEQSSLAYEAWNELYRKDRNYRNIQYLVTQLRKEMEVDKFIKDESTSIMETIT